MGWKAKLTRMFGGEPQPAPLEAPITPEPEPEEISVPEMPVAELRTALTSARPPLVLDIREPYEWNQVHLTGALHIPMNSVPENLDALPPDRPIAVLCAHGNRSYGVTHYLREQGFDAHNVTGGIARWYAEGGDVVVGKS